MRQILIITFLLLCIPALVLAETISFGWTPNTSDTEGYRLYETLGDSVSLVATIDSSDTATASIEQENDGNCHTYYLVAFNFHLESEPSDTATWCPDTEIPGIEVRPGQPATFMITITPVQ